MMKKQQKRSAFLAVIVCLSVVIGTWVFSDNGTAKSIRSADDGLAGISQVRRTLRAACNKLKTIDSLEASRAVLLQESAAESRQALMLWQEFRKVYPESAPALADPVEGSGEPVKNQQALKTFSGAVDAFAASIQSADKNVLSHRYAAMMSEMEAAYNLYL